MKLRMLLLAWLASPMLLAHEHRLYVPQGLENRDWTDQIEPLLEQDSKATWRTIPLSRHPANLEEAKRSVEALRDGATALPCIALVDERGSYACLGLPLASGGEDLAQAQQAATSPEREAAAARRNFEADCAGLHAELHFSPPSTPEQSQQYAERARALSQSPAATVEERQIILLRTLYPLLLLRYTQLYTGAHNPETEAALQEAITALEQARDLDRNTTAGHQAFDERERLRAARLQSRQYD